MKEKAPFHSMECYDCQCILRLRQLQFNITRKYGLRRNLTLKTYSTPKSLLLSSIMSSAGKLPTMGLDDRPPHLSSSLFGLQMQLLLLTKTSFEYQSTLFFVDLDSILVTFLCNALTVTGRPILALTILSTCANY